MENTLERIIPELIRVENRIDNQTLHLHLDRYHFAGRNILPGTIADIACGVGYGSYLLITQYGEVINRIYGVDKDAESIQWAIDHYPNPLITYCNKDAFDFNPPELLNSIVCLEAIEHLPNPEMFIRQVSEHLAPGGRFIASVPITPSMDANPYHLSDFTRSGFSRLFISSGFRMLNFLIQKQSYNPFIVRNQTEMRYQQLRKNIFQYYSNNPRKFFLRLSSIIRDGFCNKYMIATFEKL